MAEDYSSFKLNDKIAIVTGASQGIGKAIALGLARRAHTSCWRNIPRGARMKSTPCRPRFRLSDARPRSSPST